MTRTSTLNVPQTQLPGSPADDPALGAPMAAKKGGGPTPASTGAPGGVAEEHRPVKPTESGDDQAVQRGGGIAARWAQKSEAYLGSEGSSASRAVATDKAAPTRAASRSGTSDRSNEDEHKQAPRRGGAAAGADGPPSPLPAAATHAKAAASTPGGARKGTAELVVLDSSAHKGPPRSKRGGGASRAAKAALPKVKGTTQRASTAAPSTRDATTAATAAKQAPAAKRAPAKSGRGRGAAKLTASPYRDAVKSKGASTSRSGAAKVKKAWSTQADAAADSPAAAPPTPASDTSGSSSGGRSSSLPASAAAAEAPTCGNLSSKAAIVDFLRGTAPRGFLAKHGVGPSGPCTLTLQQLRVVYDAFLRRRAAAAQRAAKKRAARASVSGGVDGQTRNGGASKEPEDPPTGDEGKGDPVAAEDSGPAAGSDLPGKPVKVTSGTYTRRSFHHQNEDRVVTFDDLNAELGLPPSPRYSLAVVADGHAGRQCSEFVKAQLPREVRRSLCRRRTRLSAAANARKCATDRAPRHARVRVRARDDQEARRREGVAPA